MTIKQQTLVFINTLLLSITMVSAAQIHHGAFSMGASNTARHQTTMGQPIVSSHTEQDSSLQDGLWNIRFMEAEFTLSDNWGYLDLEVNLNNISSAYRTSIDSCYWDFGDGYNQGIMLTDSTTCNTSHTYYLPDTSNIIDYYVTFKVFDTAGNFDYEPDSIHLVRMVPGFSFSFQDDEDYHPDAIIDFENTSIDPEGIIDTLWWDMGYNGIMASVVKADTGNVFTCTADYADTDSSYTFPCGECSADNTDRICWNDDNPIPSPRHKFEQPGDFAVKLTVADNLNNKEVLDSLAEVKWFEPIFETQLNISYDPSNLIQYDVSLTPNQGYVPLPVSFSDVSDTINTYLDSCFWSFGDSTAFGFTVNDSVPDCSINHTYTEYDITNPYSVSLTVFDTSKTKTQLIERHIRVVHPFPGDSVIFVSNSGSDDAGGAFGDPLATIKEAVSIAEADRDGINTIVIEEGYYEENVIVTHPNLHITSYFSVDSLYDHVDSTIVDGGWKDEWEEGSEEYEAYMAPYYYTDSNGIQRDLSARSVFFFSNPMFYGNMVFYEPDRSQEPTRTTGLTIQNGIGTVLNGNWDNDNIIDSRRMGGGVCILGTISNMQYCNQVNNGRKLITDSGGNTKAELKENTHIGDVDRLFHRSAPDKFRQLLESPGTFNLFTKIKENELSLLDSSNNSESSRESYSFNFTNNYFENNYAIIGKTISIESGDNEISLDISKSTLDYVYLPRENPAISNYWLTKDENVSIVLDDCSSIDTVKTGEIDVESGADIDEVLGSIYGGIGEQDRRTLGTKLVLHGTQYDTSNTTFPLQMVTNTSIKGYSANRDTLVRLNSEYESPIILMREVSGVNLQNLELRNGVSMDNGGMIEVVNSKENDLSNMKLKGGLSIKRGGGIYISNDIDGPVRDDDTTMTMTDVEIEDNDSILEGGGVYFSNANLYIDGLEVIGNSCNNPETQYHGGGIFGADVGSVVIENSIIHDNDASVTGVAAGSWGGGIHFENVTAAMRNVQITNNKAIDKAGAIYLQDSDLNMYNCTIADNLLLQGGWGSAIHTQKSGFGGHKYLYLTNSIIWNNENSIYPNSGSQLSGDFIASFGIDLYIHHTLIEGLGNLTPPNMMAYFQLELQNYGDPSNLNTDPLFSGVSGSEYSLSDESPCIDAGTDYYEIDTGFETIVVVDIPESDYFGSAPDMGANETEPPPIGDVNGDGVVNVADIVILANFILDNEYNVLGDLNGDGELNVIDIVMIVDFILDVNARGEEATYAEFKLVDNNAYIIADGIVSGIQMTLSHSADFQINMTDKALLAEYKTNDNETILVVAAPESEELFTFSGEFEVIELIVANSLGEIESRLMPTEFTLTSAYPNPFNPVTRIEFGLPVDSHVSMTVYDLQGRLVTTLSDEIKSAGYHTITWNASQQASGVYFVSIYAQNTDISTVGSGIKQSYTKTQKVMLVK